MEPVGGGIYVQSIYRFGLVDIGFLNFGNWTKLDGFLKSKTPIFTIAYMLGKLCVWVVAAFLKEKSFPWKKIGNKNIGKTPLWFGMVDFQAKNYQNQKYAKILQYYAIFCEIM